MIPGWIRRYDRAWLRPDIVAAIIVWSVVTPQCVAYAKIAGLPPEAGLMAAPGAMIGYALIGGSRTLIVSATTAGSAVSAAAVGPLAHGQVAQFASLSAALAIVTALVLAAAGVLGLGGIADLVSKPVMTGFLFGLGITIIVSQLPSALGIPAGSGDFIPRMESLIRHLGSVHLQTLAVGVGCLGLLIALKRGAPRVPGTLVVLALAILFSAILHLPDHGVAVVGKLPRALPDLAFPGVSAHDFVALVPTAFGVMLLTTEAVGVARALAGQDHYTIEPNRELLAIGAGNALAGLSSGFVQSGGASQTAAAQAAGGKSQLVAVIAAGLVLLTGAFLAPLFTDLPDAALAAIVIVAVSGFLRVGELRRFARVRRSALLFSLLAIAGVLGLGVLGGLIVTAVLSMGSVISILSRPEVAVMVRDPASGAWGAQERHPDWRSPASVLVVGLGGPLFYANSGRIKDRLLALTAGRDPTPETVAIDLSNNLELDLQSADMLGELAHELSEQGTSLHLARVRGPAADVLERSGVLQRVRVDATLDAAAL